MSKRPITPLKLTDVVPAPVVGLPPEMRMAPPTSLHVDLDYQRGLSERSLRLIRKIVAEWNWSAFKPPIVEEVDGVMDIIDGQHTAIAAATRGIELIPVMVTQTDAMSGRATAFVRHNRDRIQVTPTQLHTAMVAAGDEDAVTIDQVCERAGVRILRNPPPMGRFQVGDTVAITSVRSLINRRYPAGARKVLEVCVKAGAAPVSADMIKAVEHLLHAEEYRTEIDADRISAVMQAMGATLLVETERFAAERRVQKWRAMASVIFMNKRKARNG